MDVRVFVEEALNIACQNEQIGGDKYRNVSGEHIVVAKDDLFDGGGIVFVDDGKVGIFDQLSDRVKSILTRGLILKIAIGHQALGRVDPEIAKDLVVGP